MTDLWARVTTVAVAAAVAALGLASPAMAADEGTTVLTPTDDTYTYPESPSWDVGGHATAESSSYPKINSTAWLRFDLGSLPKDVVVSGATLELTTSWSNRSTLAVHSAPSNWREGMTHRTAVSVGNRLASVPATGPVVTADLRNADLEAGRPFAVAIPPATQDRVGYHFRTSESAKPPRLIVSWARSAQSVPRPPQNSVSADTLYGSSIYHIGQTFPEGLAKSDQMFGRLHVVRVFYPGAPKPWPGNAGHPMRPVVVSFKYPMAEIIAGRHDRELRQWFAEAPRDRTIWWSLHHEPEDDIERGGFTAAQYRSAWKRVVGLASEASNPNLRATLILMDWTISPKSGRSFLDYYPGDSYIDVLAFDAYNPFHWQSYRDPSLILEPLARLAQQRGKHWAIAEFGAMLVRNDPTGAQRAAWITDYARTAESLGAEFVTYWDSTGRGTNDFLLSDKPSQDAWRQVITGTGSRR